MRKIISYFIIVFTIGFLPIYLASAAAAPISIMPLGNSITFGSSSGASPDDDAHQVSYRKALWDKLIEAGYETDFVGSQNSGGAIITDPNHEGHGGWCADGCPPSNILTEIYNFLASNPADTVLLHIGTNDINSGHDPQAAASAVSDILDEIYRYGSDHNRQIWVILALIINQQNPPCTKCAETTAFNNELRQMAENRIQNGDKIILVDMENGAGIDYRQVPDGDMWDLLHPYETGYQKMANVWYNGLKQILLSADAGLDQNLDENTSVTLDGSQSYDRVFNITSYQWEQIGGSPTVVLTNPNTAQASFTAPDVGPGGASLTFQLTLTNDRGIQQRDTCIVHINDCAPPGAFSYASPSNGAAEISTSPTLDWGDASGATSYDVQVCSDSSCSTAVGTDNVAASQWPVSPALNQGATYWWRARANNSCGPGPWNSAWSFTTVTPAPTITTSTPLPVGTVGIVYVQTLSATGGSTPYSWSVVSGSLPPGLSLGSSTGVISGTPTAANTYAFRVRVTGSNALYSEKDFSLTLNPAPTAPTITTSSPLPGGTVSTAYSQTLQATGGSTPYSWSVVSGSLPPGLSLGSSTGVISGTPTAANTFTFRIRVTGSNSLYSEKDFSLTISCPIPATPSSPSPANGATGVSTSPTLSWTSSNADSYDVYFGTSSNPPLAGNITSAGYPRSGLTTSTIYYWKIVAKNNCGQSPSGPVWSFTTSSAPDNISPETTITSGPSGTINTGSASFSYTGSDNVTSPANLVYATFLQGYDSGWSSFSSVTTKSYSNLPDGSYTFQVKARDEAGNEDLSPATRSFTVQNIYQLSCSDTGIQCVERIDGQNDSHNLVNGQPKADVEYEFRIIVQDTGGTPQYVRLLMTQRNDPTEIDFYDYDMACTGTYSTGAICTYRTMLGPAVVHKFYLEAKMANGTPIRYPSTGYITGPTVYLLAGNNLVGIPRDINNANLDGQQAFGSPDVYRWDSTQQYFTKVTVSEPVKVGEGYIIDPLNATLIELGSYGDVPGLEYTYPLNPGMNLISNPFGGNVRLSDVKIQKGNQTPVPWQEAVTREWVIDAIYYYIGEDWGDIYTHITANDDAKLVPWVGYWVYLKSTDDIYYLVIPRP